MSGSLHSSKLVKATLAFRGLKDNWVRVNSVICWRCLQGRSCFTKKQSQISSDVDIVLVPIPSKGTTLQASAALQHARAVTEQLAAAGFLVTLDDDSKSTPGAKFYKWECLGVPIRIEIGASEASSQTCTVTFPSPPPDTTPQLAHNHSTDLAHLQTYRKPKKICNVSCADAITICNQHLLHSSSRSPGGRCNKLHLWANAQVCTAHLKYLLGVVGSCHCGAHHYSMAELKDEVAAQYFRANGCKVHKWINDNGKENANTNITLFVGHLPTTALLKDTTAALWLAFTPFEVVRVKVARAHQVYCRGWARVLLDNLAAAEAALHHFQGTIEVLSHPATLSRATGRADALFPDLPLRIRSRLRIDEVAAYSVADQHTADQITKLVASLTAAALHLPPPDAHSPSPPPTRPQTSLGNRSLRKEGSTPIIPPSRGKARMDPGIVNHSTYGGSPCEAVTPPRHPSITASLTPPVVDPCCDCAPGPSSTHFSPSGAVSPQITPQITPSNASPVVEPRCADAARPSSIAGSMPSSQPPPRSSPVTQLLPVTLTDGTACCGGSTISFLQAFQRVNAVEVDEDRCDDLRHNLRLVGGLEEVDEDSCDEVDRPGQAAASDQLPICGHARVYNADYTAQLHAQLEQEVVFLDPPWGGPQYKQQGCVADLPLGSMTLVQLAAELSKHCRLLCMRLPSSMDIEGVVRGVIGRLQAQQGGVCKTTEGEGGAGAGGEGPGGHGSALGGKPTVGDHVQGGQLDARRVRGHSDMAPVSEKDACGDNSYTACSTIAGCGDEPVAADKQLGLGGREGGSTSCACGDNGTSSAAAGGGVPGSKQQQQPSCSEGNLKDENRGSDVVVAAQVPIGGGRLVVFVFGTWEDAAATQQVEGRVLSALAQWSIGHGKHHKPLIYDAIQAAFVALKTPKAGC